jgi:hypothetical protein
MVSNRVEYDKKKDLVSHVEVLDSKIIDHFQAVAAGEDRDVTLNVGANRSILLAIALWLEEVIGPANSTSDARSNSMYANFVHNAIAITALAQDSAHDYITLVHTNILSGAPPDFAEGSGSEGTD